MTQEDKGLLLKDLYARLPYGFIVHRYSDNADIRIDSIITFGHFLEYSEGENFKPYLRPMSSMTEDEKDFWKTTHKHHCKDWEYTDWLLKHHFDFRGLIEKGLALEAPTGMYK